MGSIRWNRLIWGNPDNWPDGGDGWDFHAKFCRQPYEAWKDSVVKEFLVPYLGPQVDVVEIGPGQGRWSQFIIANARTVALVDLSSNCIEACRRRFAHADSASVSFHVNDGISLPIESASVDLVWSFGAFVHIELPEIDRYLGEVRRVLRPGGRFVIHHAGRSERPEDHRAETEPGGSPDAGLRSEVSARQFAEVTADNGLVVDQQIWHWGPRCEFGLAFRDVISIGTRPLP